jgi:hypothetical protein
MSIVLVGSTSGSVTLQEPAVAGSTVLDLPAVSGTVLTTTSPKAGNVIQVVSATYSTSSTTTSTSFVDTGLSASITPTSSSSKILVLVSMFANSNVTSGNARDTGGSFRVVRTSTAIWGSNSQPNFYIDGSTGATLSFNVHNLWNVNYLDSPATTSSTTYKIQYSALSGRTIGINPGSTADSVLTLMEIAA